MITDERQIENILANEKFSMEIERFTIDDELEEIGRGILNGEISIQDYKEQTRLVAMRCAHEV